MSQLYKNSYFALGLLFSGAMMAVISVVGFTYNPGLFSTFSWTVFALVFSIAGYMLYNIRRLTSEVKHKGE